MNSLVGGFFFLFLFLRTKVVDYSDRCDLDASVGRRCGKEAGRKGTQNAYASVHRLQGVLHTPVEETVMN